MTDTGPRRKKNLRRPPPPAWGATAPEGRGAVAARPPPFARTAAAPCPAAVASKPSALLDSRVVDCGDNLEQLQKLPDGCVDLAYIDPPFNSNRNYEVFWGETKERRSFEDRATPARRRTSTTCGRAASS